MSRDRAGEQGLVRGGNKSSESEFAKDIAVLVERLAETMGQQLREPLLKIGEKLVDLHKRGLVKINHSVMEVICAGHMVRLGYDVDVERYLGDSLVCDVFGEKGGGAHIVEIETGFAPPEAALDPQRYLRARVVSKVARYSKYSDKFSLATPRYNVLEIPEPLLKPPRLREPSEIKELKELCDIYYSRPPIQLDELRNCRIHSIIILNIDNLGMTEYSPETYYERILKHVYY
ncbi:MAG: hypothetical protein RMJ28_04580 [Nitrososphaerota archaeon]|nr:hypothetical protein [Candidatus Calditenuaceae archaeon]MDW8073495.1 hypothetical protein [Nitrososphaerota archaeon]